MIEEWKLSAQLVGAMNIESANVAASKVIPELASIRLEPNTNGSEQQSGVFAFEATLKLARNAGISLEPSDVFHRTRDILDILIARLALSVGTHIRLLNGFSVKQQIGFNPTRYRVIASAEGRSITSPTMLNPNVLAVPLDDYTERALGWWNRGVGITDPVDRLQAFFVALDVLASALTINESRNRECEKCGHTTQMKAGLAQKVHAFLTIEHHIENDVAKRIYKTRNSLIHGGGSVVATRMDEFAGYANILAVVIRREIAKRMGLALSTEPDSLDFDMDGAFLTVDYMTQENGSD